MDSARVIELRGNDDRIFNCVGLLLRIRIPLFSLTIHPI